MSKNVKRKLAELATKQILKDREQEAQAKQRIKDLTELAGDGALDGLVHDLVSAQATAVNNSGVKGQIDWLTENYGVTETARMLEETLNG